MGIGANKALASRYIELWNTGNLALADEVLALDFVDHTHPELPPGPGAVKHEVTAFRRAFLSHASLAHALQLDLPAGIQYTLYR